MAVKRYDGSQWVTVAGKGDQGTSSSIATWVKTASGGETSVSGNDDNSQPLSYTVGQELVFINGALQKRGADYTATTGNSITGLTALAANDVVTVWTVNAFSVTNAISNTLVDAKGDLVTASGADVPAILTAPSTNGYVLTSDSAQSLGIKWAAAATGAMTKISTTTFSNVATQDFDSVFSSSYNNYLVVINELYAATAADDLYLRFKYSSTVQATGYYAGNWYVDSAGSSGSLASNGANQISLSNNTGGSGSKGGGYFYFRTTGGSSAIGMINGQYYSANSPASFAFGGDTQFSQTWTGFRLLSSSTNISGTVTVYGLEK